MFGFVPLAARRLYADGLSTWSLLCWRYLLALIIMFAGIRLAGLRLLPPAKGQTPDTRYTCLNHRRAMTAQRLDRNRPSG